jgi:hypothetical protein
MNWYRPTWPAACRRRRGSSIAAALAVPSSARVGRGPAPFIFLACLDPVGHCALHVLSGLLVFVVGCLGDPVRWYEGLVVAAMPAFDDVVTEEGVGQVGVLDDDDLERAVECLNGVVDGPVDVQQVAEVGALGVGSPV